MTALSLSGELTIFRAAELKDELLQALPPADQAGQADAMLELDLSQVSELDTAGLQLLMLLKKTAGQRGCELRLQAHSPAVLEVFELLNVAAFFGDALVMPVSA